ncbi:MAG: NAD(+)/NADH kinase [Alicyclobacillaceae bacterium]|nr:NAD(+)/NADH kinase [Alicyclobacillaceae bacterium]
MRTILLVVNQQKPKACGVAEQIVRQLEAARIRTVVAEAGTRGTHHLPTGVLETAELAFVLGGDGTMLGVARELAPARIPILGINVGHLGFLTQAEPHDVEETVRRVINRDYDLEPRLMIQASVWRGSKCVAQLTGLNDAGIAKGSFARMVTVEVYVDGVLVDAYSGDGVIVSTPTGSTAYSLSCGGPILTPRLQVMLITPICPHTLFSRPCVIDDRQEVRMVVHATHDDLGLTVDGQVGVRLQSGDVVEVRRSEAQAILVKWRDREFFSVLRHKLREGVNHGRV